MNKKEIKILTAVAVFALTTTALLLVNRHKEKRQQSVIVADEGYELAHDVLYPHRHIPTKKLKYGPVLPA